MTLKKIVDALLPLTKKVNNKEVEDHLVKAIAHLVEANLIIKGVNRAK